MMFIKVHQNVDEYFNDSVNVKNICSYSRKFGKHTFYCLISTVTVLKLEKELNDILFNTDTEIIYISEEEAYRMGINYSGDKK